MIGRDTHFEKGHDRREVRVGYGFVAHASSLRAQLVGRWRGEAVTVGPLHRTIYGPPPLRKQGRK